MDNEEVFNQLVKEQLARKWVNSKETGNAIALILKQHTWKNIDRKTSTDITIIDRLLAEVLQKNNFDNLFKNINAKQQQEIMKLYMISMLFIELDQDNLSWTEKINPKEAIFDYATIIARVYFPGLTIDQYEDFFMKLHKSKTSLIELGSLIHQMDSHTVDILLKWIFTSGNGDQRYITTKDWTTSLTELWFSVFSQSVNASLWFDHDIFGEEDLPSMKFTTMKDIYNFYNGIYISKEWDGYSTSWERIDTINFSIIISGTRSFLHEIKHYNLTVVGSPHDATNKHRNEAFNITDKQQQEKELLIDTHRPLLKLTSQKNQDGSDQKDIVVDKKYFINWSDNWSLKNVRFDWVNIDMKGRLKTNDSRIMKTRSSNYENLKDHSDHMANQFIIKDIYKQKESALYALRWLYCRFPDAQRISVKWEMRSYLGDMLNQGMIPVLLNTRKDIYHADMNQEKYQKLMQKFIGILEKESDDPSRVNPHTGDGYTEVKLLTKEWVEYQVLLNEDYYKGSLHHIFYEVKKRLFGWIIRPNRTYTNKQLNNIIACVINTYSESMRHKTDKALETIAIDIVLENESLAVDKIPDAKRAEYISQLTENEAREIIKEVLYNKVAQEAIIDHIDEKNENRDKKVHYWFIRHNLELLTTLSSFPQAT